MSKRKLVSLLIGSCLSLCSLSPLGGCATTRPGGAAAEPAPTLVSVEDDYSVVLEALEKTRKRIDDERSRLEELGRKLSRVRAEPRGR